jgi:hypothetical protein
MNVAEVKQIRPMPNVNVIFRPSIVALLSPDARKPSALTARLDRVRQPFRFLSLELADENPVPDDRICF